MIAEHTDANMFPFLVQDQVGGLQVQTNGGWLPITPVEGTIVVNIGYVIQVLRLVYFFY